MQHSAQAISLTQNRKQHSAEELAAQVRLQLGIPADKIGLTLPTVAVERRDTLRRNGAPVQELILRSPNEPPLPVLFARPPGKAAPTKIVLWLPDRGKAALADSAGLLSSYLNQGAVVLLADLRGLGETADPAALLDRKYYNREYAPALQALHLGRPLLAQRVADVVLLLSFLQAEPGLANVPLEVHATGRGRAVALHAAVLTPLISRVVLPAMPPSYLQMLQQPTARDTYSEVLPGVLQRYDLPDLARVLGPRLQVR
jgi:hypothetical protein